MDQEDKCISYECDLRMSCARFNDPGYGPGTRAYGDGSGDGERCKEFLVRHSLGGGNPDVVFLRGRGKTGRIHNPHAGVRTSYPGSEALFGKIFGGGKKRARATPDGRKPLPQKPDLMVKRHIRDGRDINDPENK